MNVTGTLTIPATCTLTAPTTVPFGTRTSGTVLDQAFSITINCTNGLSYSVSAPASTSVVYGSDTLYLSVTNVAGSGGVNIATTAITGTGSAANQIINLNMSLRGAASGYTPVPSHISGSFSTNVTITATY